MIVAYATVAPSFTCVHLLTLPLDGGVKLWLIRFSFFFLLLSFVLSRDRREREDGFLFLVFSCKHLFDSRVFLDVFFYKSSLLIVDWNKVYI